MRPLALAAVLLLSACAPTAPAPDATAPTVLVFVRHAEKAAEPSADPGLTAAGVARSEALADALEHAGVEVLVGSQFRRTTDTAAPLAARLGRAVETRPLDLDDPAGSAAALARSLAEEHAGRTVLVVGHSNTVPAMVNALTGLALDPLSEADYGGLYVVVLGGPEPRLIRSRVPATAG